MEKNYLEVKIVKNSEKKFITRFENIINIHVTKRTFREQCKVHRIPSLSFKNLTVFYYLKTIINI